MDYAMPAQGGKKHEMSDEEKKMRGKMDLRTLVEAEEIKSDSERMKMVKMCHQEEMEALKKVKTNG